MEPVQYGANLPEFLKAMRSTRSAKNVFWLLLGLAIMLQIGAFVAVEFFDVLKSAQPVTHVSATTTTTLPAENADKPVSQEQATTAAADHEADDAAQTSPKDIAKPTSPPLHTATARAATWRQWLEWALPVTQVLGLLSAMLLVLVLLFAVKIALLGRLPGLSNYLSAFFWSLILLVVIIPWQLVIRESFMNGALFDFRELLMARASCDEGAQMQCGLYYVRFLAYPAITLLVWLSVGIKFACGFRKTTATPREPMPTTPRA